MNRRGLLTGLAGITALPAAFVMPSLRPDGELLDLCAAIPALRDACNALPDHVECEDGQPNWDAYTAALDRIYEIDPAHPARRDRQGSRGQGGSGGA